MEDEEAGAFCPECGYRLCDEARFCSSCGRAVPGRAPAAVRVHATTPVSVLAVVALVMLAAATGAGVFVLVDNVFRPAAVETSATARVAPSTAEAAAVRAPATPGATRAARAVPPGAFLDELASKAEAAPNDLSTWRTLADARYRAALFDRQRLPAAAAALDHVVELDPADSKFIRMRADVAYDAGDYRTAVAFLERYLALAPKDEKARLDLGSALALVGEASAAKAVYQELIDKGDELISAYLGLGMVLYSQKDADGAMSMFVKARALARTPSDKSRVEGVIANAAK